MLASRSLLDFADLVDPRSNLSRALALANVVADERYELYLEFVAESGNKIGEYLTQVRQASLASLGNGGNAFGC